MQATELLLLGLYPSALCTCIGTDLARRVIPNVVVASLVAGFAALAALSPLPDLTLRLLVAAVVTVLGFNLFCQGLVGAGDVKLAGAVMLWLDPVQLPLFLMACGFLGAALAVAVAAGQRRSAAGAGLAGLARRHTLPYGVALAGAGLMLHPFSSLVALP